MNSQAIPGFCECGCGSLTKLATKTFTERGYKKGDPVRFVYGHQIIRTIVTPDLWVVEDRGYETPCWVCVMGQISDKGYRKFRMHNRPTLAHRAMYEQEVGPIPDGYEIDHLCRVTSCINPAHLEAVTSAVNKQRSPRTKLTPDQVREIRATSGTFREIAERFGVSTGNIGSIRCGYSWKSIE